MLPFGPGQRFLKCGGVAGKIVGGWELSAIHSTRTGRAINFSVSRSSKDLPDGNSSNQRPDVVPGVSIYPENQTIDNWFNIAAFAVPKTGTWGNAARNLGRGPGVNTLDLSLQKTANITEKHRIAFRAEFFNIFNRPHLGTPASNISSPGSFGRITSPMNRSHRDRHGAADPVHVAVHFLSEPVNRARYPLAHAIWQECVRHIRRSGLVFRLAA